MSAIRMSAARTSWTLKQVSSTSERGHALVDETRLFGADMFGEMGEEGDDVMLGDRLDLVDPGDVELDVLGFPHRVGVLLRDHPELCLGVAGMRLDLEPDAELGGGLPDRGHLGAGIAGDHGSAFRFVPGARAS
jgi:hypothetical protein